MFSRSSMRPEKSHLKALGGVRNRQKRSVQTDDQSFGLASMRCVPVSISGGPEQAAKVRPPPRIHSPDDLNDLQPTPT
jgi:hypothetical protein